MMQPRMPPDKDTPKRVHEHPDPTKHDLVGEICGVMGSDGKPVNLEERFYFQPSEEEAAKIATGAPVVLHMEGPALSPDEKTGPQHLPGVGPLLLTTGEAPPNAQPPVDFGHMHRALGAMFSLLAEPLAGSKSSGFVVQHMGTDGEPTTGMLTPGMFLDLFGECLDATRATPGDGVSIADLALPTDVRDDL